MPFTARRAMPRPKPRCAALRGRTTPSRRMPPTTWPTVSCAAAPSARPCRRSPWRPNRRSTLVIAEDALFNYGKLQYELGGGVFNEAINVLGRYLERYPDSPRADEARELLAWPPITTPATTMRPMPPSRRVRCPMPTCARRCRRSPTSADWRPTAAATAPRRSACWPSRPPWA